MKNGSILSGIVGGICFAVPYIIFSEPLGMTVAFSVSMLTGIFGFGAGTLMFSDSKTKEYTIDLETEGIDQIISKAKKMNTDIIEMVNKIEDSSLQIDIREIYQTSTKIINTVEKNPKKIKYVKTFFSYFLPETLKLLNKYDEIENQNLGKSGEDFMIKTRKMISKIKLAFNEQLAHLYQEDIIDTDAEMKVFDSMIKSEGFDGNDFKL